MVKGAWPATPQAAIESEEQRWRRLRDAARSTYLDSLENNRQLRQALQSDGFDALHQDRELVAKNWDFLAETRNDAMQIFRQAADARELLRESMSMTVYQRHQEIALVEANPLIKDDAKKAFVEALVEETNAELIARSAAAGAALTAAASQHLSYLASLPWHMSTADGATSAAAPPSNGVQAMSAGWKQSPTATGTEGGSGSSGTGTGGDRPGQTNQGSQKPSTDSSASRPGQSDQPAQKPKTGPGEGGGVTRPAPSNQGANKPVTGPQGLPGPGPATSSSPLTLPPVGGGGGPGLGGGPGGGGLTGLSGGGAGGLRVPGSFAGPPQGLLPSQLAGVGPSSSLSSVPQAAASGLSGGGVPKASVPLPLQSPVTPPVAAPAANVVAGPAGAASGGPSVQPAGLSPAAPAPVTQGPAAVAGPLGPAPPLPTPPPSAAAPQVGPVAPPAPPPSVGGGPGPFHTPLPPVGTPMVRRGLIQVAEDPDLIRARQLIWELMWAGRRYPSLDWAVGLHRGQGGVTKFFLTSSDGESYIPQHVFLPADPALVPLFLDVDFVQRGWRETWQGWVDPARIVVEHHRLRAEVFGQPVLHAVVSSREITGLGHLLPSGVKLEVAAAEDNPFIDPEKARDVPVGVPAGRAHRLSVLMPRLWGLVQRMPKSQRWSAAVDLATDAAKSTDERHVRTGLIVRDAAPMDAVDPHGSLLHGILDHLRDGESIAVETWQQLQTAYFTHLMQSQSRRHTGADLTDDTGYVDAYRRARAYEAAWLLDAPEGPLTPEWLADVAYAHVVATDDGYRTGQLMAERAA